MIKKILIGAASALMLCIFRPMSTMAAETNDSVKIDESGYVTLTSDHASKDEINTLRLSLEVSTDVDSDISFEFNPENNAKISEYRFNADSNQLNIYMSGTETLFLDSDTLDLGSIVATDESGNNVAFNVNATTDSLKYVYNNELITPDLDVDIVTTTPVTTSTTTSTTTTTTTTTTTKPTTTTTTTTTTKPTTTTTTTTTKKPTTTTSTTTTSKKTTTTTKPTTTTTTTIVTEPVTTTVSNIASDDDLCSWAVNDYQSKTGITASNAELTIDSDGMYVITLLDESATLLDSYTIDPETGIGTNSADEEVNLPQTGINALNNVLIVLGSIMLIAMGFCITKASGVIRRKENE